MQLRGFAVVYVFMRLRWVLAGLGCIASSAVGQIQVELKFPRLQYIAYEPVVANLTITNLAGRDVDLRDSGAQSWFGFEVSGSEGQPIPQISHEPTAPLSVAAGQTVTRKIDLTPLYGVHDFGTYRVRAHIYFGGLNQFFYSPTKVFEVTDARPIWQKTVGVPQNGNASGNVRTYSLMTNRFADHTSLYVRVEDKNRGMVYATYSLGRIIAFDQPQTEFDHSNQLHVLYCAAPRMWSYARIGLNGELVSRISFAETKRRPRLVHSNDGVIKVAGGMMDPTVTQAVRDAAPELSARPAGAPKND
ncbi:MAG TPA: hypothetical protein VLK27_04200 [Chthoniobacterales bacterium]|nr:hypothetical protein [Chthoniobacterales bacterium]